MRTPYPAIWDCIEICLYFHSRVNSMKKVTGPCPGYLQQQAQEVQYLPWYLHKRSTSDYPHFWLFSGVVFLRYAQHNSAWPSNTPCFELLLCQLPHDCSGIKSDSRHVRHLHNTFGKQYSYAPLCIPKI